VFNSNELDRILAAFEVESYLLRLVTGELAMKSLDSAGHGEDLHGSLVGPPDGHLFVGIR
jgi:hypothetical protein